MADSDRFGQLVRDIVGKLGVRAVEQLTGVSAAYIGFMKKGKVPSEELLAKFAAGFRLSQDRTQELFEAARESKPNIDLERVLHAVCDAAGLPTESRLKVLDTFREELEASEEPHANAA